MLKEKMQKLILRNFDRLSSPIVLHIIFKDRIKAYGSSCLCLCRAETAGESALFSYEFWGVKLRSLMLLKAKTLLSHSPKYTSCNFYLKTLSQQSSMFCPSSLLLHICHKNMKRYTTSGTVESHPLASVTILCFLHALGAWWACGDQRIIRAGALSNFIWVLGIAQQALRYSVISLALNPTSKPAKQTNNLIVLYSWSAAYKSQLPNPLRLQLFSTCNCV